MNNLVSRELKILISKTVTFYISRSILDGNQGAPYALWCIQPLSPIGFSRGHFCCSTWRAKRTGPPKHMGHFVTLLPLLRPSSFLCHGLCTPVPLSHYSPCSFSFASARPAKVTQLRLICCRRRYSCWFLQGVFLCIFYIPLHIPFFIKYIIIT